MTGVAWVFIQPVITLLIYWFVFEKIFQARFSNDENDFKFIVYLAIGFWPWMAFSESVIRSITSVEDKKDLIGKIRIDFSTPVIAAISATFLLNLIGYAFVILIIIIFNEGVLNIRLLLILIPLLQLYFFSIALGLLFSSLQIFIKDTIQFIATIMGLWFFLTPIIYSESILPKEFKSIIQYNPLYTPITFIHSTLNANKELPWIEMLYISLFIIVLLYVSKKVFKKLSPYFVDFK